MVRFDVVTFGSGVVDVFASTDISEIASATGRNKGKGVRNKSVNRLDLEVGCKYLIDELRFDVGGGATNVAVAFARFGLKTGCVCGIGADDNGKRVIDCLKKEKIKFLGKVGKGETGYSMIVNSKKHNRTILTYKGMSNNVGIDGVKNFKTRWLYFSSLLGKGFETQKKLAKRVVGDGGALILNPSYYIIEKKDISGLLKLASVLILNKEEAVALVGRYGKRRGVRGERLSLLEGLHALGPRIVVVTDKNKKVICSDGEEDYSIVPHKGRKVVERTGAGDAFAAGFVGGLVVGMKIEDCLKLAVEESEAVLGHFGAKNDLLKRRLK